MEFEQVWQRIINLAGETFYELGGSTFTYEIHDGGVKPSTADALISPTAFQRVCAQGECPPPRQLKEQGFNSREASYIFSILTDPRLKGG
jgi:hypothetical protein